jgi:transcriptional regulator with XRE-family HTH domain
MSTNGMNVAAAPKSVSTLSAGKLHMVPRDGRHFIATLVGGYKETRAEIGRELLELYGIWCKHHISPDRHKDPSPIYIATDCELVIFLIEDVDKVLKRVLKACETARVDNIGISRKSHHNWFATFKLRGFDSPPKWRDGFNVDQSPLGPDKLDHIEPPRLAYEDPALKALRQAKIDVAEPVAELTKGLEQQKALQPAPPPPPKPPVRLLPGTQKPASTGFGSALRQARVQAGVSQRELSMRLGMSQFAVSSWELGNAKPDATTFARLKGLYPALPDPRTEGAPVVAKPVPVIVKPVVAKPVVEEKLTIEEDVEVSSQKKVPHTMLSATAKDATSRFSKACVEARSRAHKTLEQMAEKLEVSKSGFALWEHGTGGMPTWKAYAKLNKLYPDLFPPVVGLIGEVSARKQGLEFITSTSTPPPKAMPSFAKGKPARQPKMVNAPATKPGKPLKLNGSVDEYVTALNDLKAIDIQLLEWQERREETIARVNALHAMVTGQ